MNMIIEYFLSNFASNPVGFSISAFLLILGIAICQFKSMSSIVIGQCVLNFMTVLTYALGDGLSGATVCAVAMIHTFLIYWLYQKNEKEIPLWFSAFFVVVYLICSAFAYKGVIDIIPALAAVLFALSVVQTKSWKYRILIFANAFLWTAYDIIIFAPIPMLATHVVSVVSVIVGMLRLDVKEWLKKD